MAGSGFSSRELARRADLLLLNIDEPGVVRQVGAVLEIGPDAGDDAIASVGCRRWLALRGVRDELRVRELVEQHRFEYVPETWGEAYQALS